MSELATTPVDRAHSRSHLATTSKGWRIGVWPISLAAILTLLLFAVIYWQMTYVSGIELNTHTWEQRAFSFRRDPIFGTQFSPVKHNKPLSTGLWTSVPNPNHKILPLAISKHLSQTTYLPRRWDLVRLESSNTPGAAASILVLLLEAHNRGFDPFWPQWSVDQPTRAAVIWPAAQLLVEFSQYDKLPSLLDQAVLGNSPKQLTESVGQLVQLALLQYCQQPGNQAQPANVHAAAKAGLTYGAHPELQKFLEANP